ncbi:MAG: PQQ-dependent sugar dehydrogenase, partial [Proteobacteria bacterium]|nr:PQQ-dependent sugar dehydrogenase [Pseudomonadota bacterium]
FACQIDGEPRPFQDVQLTELVNGLDRPLKMISLPKSSSAQNNSKFLIVEQTGKIQLFDLRSNSFKTSLDLSDIVTDPDTNPEGGLLGLALHPKFPNVKRIFVNYTYGSKLKSRIAEFSINDDFMINRSSEKIILEIVQPYSNHNGGDIVFGPDGYLYAGFGDGGSAGDPQSNAQNLKVLLGKMLRLDIDSAQPYAIPPTNPFVNNADAKSEIFALGLRNPWRFSFDRVTGDLWAGDVGQNRLEEINIVKSGGNYGWRTMEANLCFKPSNNCNKEGLIAPITQYERSQGVSVTGGYVYRGRSMPSLVGTYVYGDFQSGNIWGLRYQDGKVISETLLLQSSSKISSFAEDLSGEIYVINHEGSILKFTQNSVSNQPESRFPYKLSETKCFTSLKPLVPVESAVKYEVNSPLWSDGAIKDRFAVFPKSDSSHKVVAYTESPWEFPNDSSFIKNFYLPQKVGNQIE